jgi:hypothetical protein
LDRADYVTIENFNLVTRSSINNTVIQLINNADFNIINNNTIDMSSILNSTDASSDGIVMSGNLTSATAVGVTGKN